MHKRTTQLLSQIDAALEKGTSIETIAESLQMSPQDIKSLLSRKVVHDKKPRKKTDWRELIAHADDGRALFENEDITQRESATRITVNEPIAVVYTGDWHLGDRHTNYALWKEHIELIMNNDNIYMILLGDENQNARQFKNLAMVLEQVLSPALQIAMLNSLFDELIDGQKLLAKVIGNHDGDFDERIFGQKILDYSDKISTVPIFSNRGILDIQVGNQSYTNLLFHKSRFRSFIRPAHGAFREWQMSYPAEVVAGGHDHIPAVEIMYGRDPLGIQKETYLIKVGTYQDSDYGWKYFHNGGPMTPTVVYYPQEHKKVLFTNIPDALTFMENTKC